MTLHQQTLFADPDVVLPTARARRTDPVTSREAAAAARGLAGKHARVILSTLRRGQAMSAEEITDALAGALSALQAMKRLSELVAANLVEPTDELATNRSGRRARRYRATSNGRACFGPMPTAQNSSDTASTQEIHS